MCPNQTFWALPHHIQTQLNVPGFHTFPSQPWDQPLLKRSWFLSEKWCLETKTCAKATLFKSNQAGLPLVAQVQQGFGPFPGDLSPRWLQLLGTDAPVSPLPWAQTSGHVPLPTWHAYMCQPTRVPDCMCQIGLCLPMQGTRVLIPGPGRFHMPQSNKAHAPQLLSPWALTTEACVPRAYAHTKGSHCHEALCAELESSPHSPRPEEARAQQRRPSTDRD